MKAQFLRVHAYSKRKIQGVLDEADRQEHAVAHIKNPKKAVWSLGSRDQIDLEMPNLIE